MNMVPAPSAIQSPDTLEKLKVEYSYYDQLHREKYRDENQTREDHTSQLAHRLASDSTHYLKLYEVLKYGRFLPAGRVQAALGATEREVSPFNCSVSQPIEDSMDSIMAALSNAAKILRLGTGIGYNFSRLRPKGDEIKKLKTQSSGPLSFMKVFDVMASTIASSGHRRGAQMGIMNVDHPDIEAFVDAKMEKGAYRQFNLSVGISDEFMASVGNDSDWPLQFQGTVYKTIKAKGLWEKITKNAYHSAEPGILFIDRFNKSNNLYYCESIEATNPCAEQPLPPYGLCTLGSFNLVAYIFNNGQNIGFDKDCFVKDIHTVVEAYDNIFDDAVYAIPEHESEAKSKRRIGLGFTGIANAIEYLSGRPNYGEFDFCEKLGALCEILRDESYYASVQLAKKRGAFRHYSSEYTRSEFIRTLPDSLQRDIGDYGIRNSHLISYAPCGTISQTAWNVSSGIEPVFHYQQSRDVYMKEGKINVTLQDFNYRQYGFLGKTLEHCSVSDHMSVADTVQRYCDSSISKTVNVPESCTYDEYAQIYIQAHKMGLKGITVYRPSELRGIVIKSAEIDHPFVSEKDSYIQIQAHQAPPIGHGFNTIPTSCVNGACSL